MTTSPDGRFDTTMSASPRPMYAQPGSIGIGLEASTTLISQIPSRRFAKGPVKPAGMCCATRIGHGKLAESAVSNASNAGGPPVDVPTRTSPSPTAPAGATSSSSVSGSIFVDCDPSLRTRAADTPPVFNRTRSRNRELERNFADDAARIFSMNVGAKLSMRSETAPLGFDTKSTAPRRKASRVASAPSSVTVDTITTGVGRCTMIRSRHSRPFICGMLTSSVMTSGRKLSSCVSASRPSRAKETSNSA